MIKPLPKGISASQIINVIETSDISDMANFISTPGLRRDILSSYDQIKHNTRTFRYDGVVYNTYLEDDEIESMRIYGFLGYTQNIIHHSYTNEGSVIYSGSNVEELGDEGQKEFKLDGEDISALEALLYISIDSLSPELYDDLLWLTTSRSVVSGYLDYIQRISS